MDRADEKSYSFTVEGRSNIACCGRTGRKTLSVRIVLSAAGLCMLLSLISFPSEANVSLAETIKFMYDSGYGATAVASSLSAGLIAGRESGTVLREPDMASVMEQAEKDFRSVVGPGVQMLSVKDKDGSTVLMQIVKFTGKEKGSGERVRLHTMLIKHLIERGAEVNARNTRGRSALSYAKEYELTDIMRMLKQAGARE